MRGHRDITTVTFEDFGDGIDLRGGPIAKSAKKFQALENYIVTPGRKITNRPPLLQYPGVIDIAHSQGCFYLNGRVITIAPLNTDSPGQVATHTVAGVDTIYFDVPEGASMLNNSAPTNLDSYQILDCVIFHEQVCVLIRHAYGGACPWRNYLHIFDNKHPTYSEDPSVPPSWSPSYPLQPYGTGTHGTYKDYQARLYIVGDRLAITTAGGDIALSAVSLPRVFNTLSPTEILANGLMTYHILPYLSIPNTRFTVHIPRADLVTDKRYAAYVCEYLNANGTWSQYSEQATRTSPGDYSITEVPSRFVIGEKETRIDIYRLPGQDDGTLVRFRAILTPTVTVQSGLYPTSIVSGGGLVVDGANLTGGTMVHEGKSYNIATVGVPALPSPNQQVYLNVNVPGAPTTAEVITDATDDILPVNGQQRYWSRMVAQVQAKGTTNILSGLVRLYFYGLDNPDWALFQDDPKLPIPIAGLVVGMQIIVGSDTFKIVSLSWWLNSNAIQIIPVSGVTVHRQDYGLVVNALESTPTYGRDPTPAVFYPWYSVGFLGNYTYAIDGTSAITVGGTVIIGTTTKYMSQLVIGKGIEINGERRIVKTITSESVAEVDRPFTAAGSFVTLRDPTYQYSADVGDTGNDWYAAKEAEITLTGSGKDDALVLGTSVYDNSGALPTCIATLQDRMLVQYPSVIQSWAIGELVTSFRQLAVMGIGAGVSTRPEPVLLDGYAALPTVNGPRLFEPSGNNKDYVDFIPVGDMLRGIHLPDFTRSVWWPRLRCWITCGTADLVPAYGETYPTDRVRLFVLSVHKDTQVLAWSTWTLPGISRVDRMFVRDNVLALQSGPNLYYFNPDATNFVDSNGPYQYTARWLYNDLGSPQRNKKVMTCELVQTGKSTVRIFVNPRIATETVVGPTVTGVTLGIQRLPIMAMGPGIGLEISSSDPTGHSLDRIGFDYLLLNR